MNLEMVMFHIRSYGISRVMLDVGLRALNRVLVLRILKGIKAERGNPYFLQCNKRYRCLFLDYAALREFSKNPEYELSPQFLDAAIEKGDECYAILDGTRLAAYGWYSSRPTTFNVPGLQLYFDPRYIYMYKGFTHRDYRGQRLHAIGMTRALAAYLERGYKGLISYVDWNNFASLNSCYRMGYQDIGNGYLTGFGGRYLLRRSWGWRQHMFGFEFESPPQTAGAKEIQSA